LSAIALFVSVTTDRAQAGDGLLRKLFSFKEEELLADGRKWLSEEVPCLNLSPDVK
jgi:hypothetical protein